MIYIEKINSTTYKVNGKQVTITEYSILTPDERKYYEAYLKAAGKLKIKTSIY